MFYPLIINDPKIQRNKLAHFLEKNLIETRYLLPLLSQPIYRQLFGEKIDSAVRAVRNIPGVDILPVNLINTYEVLRHQKLILTKEAVEGLQPKADK